MSNLLLKHFIHDVLEKKKVNPVNSLQPINGFFETQFYENIKNYMWYLFNIYGSVKQFKYPNSINIYVLSKKKKKTTRHIHI